MLTEKGYQQGIDFEFKLKEDYPKRGFCCQYSKSTAHFIYRLCQEKGINLHYQHTLTNHLMVFSDNNNSFPSYSNSFQYANDTGLVADYPVFKRFDINLSSATTTASYRNFNFQNMKIPEGSAQGTQNEKANNAIEPTSEFYDYPQRHLNQARGEHYSKIEIERLEGKEYTLDITDRSYSTDKTDFSKVRRLTINLSKDFFNFPPSYEEFLEEAKKQPQPPL